MKVHYLNEKGKEVFISNVVHLQNVDNDLFIATLLNGIELELYISRIEGIADINLFNERDSIDKF